MTLLLQGSATAGGPHDRENAHALSNALMVMTIVPWAFCCICYSGLHFTYPKVSYSQIGMVTWEMLA